MRDDKEPKVVPEFPLILVRVAFDDVTIGEENCLGSAGRCTSALIFLGTALFTKKLTWVIRDDCANQASEMERRLDINDCANQDSPISVSGHVRQPGLRSMKISIVRPSLHGAVLRMLRKTVCEKNAERTSPVSVCVRFCSTAMSSTISASSRAIPLVA